MKVGPRLYGDYTFQSLLYSMFASENLFNAFCIMLLLPNPSEFCLENTHTYNLNFKFISHNFEMLPEDVHCVLIETDSSKCGKSADRMCPNLER